MYIARRLERVPTQKLGTLAKTTASAFYPAATQLYASGDTAFVRCVDCINDPVISKDQDERFEKIPRSFAEENKGISILKQNEIVVTKVGTPCYASIIEDYDEVALSRTVLGLTHIQNADPYYLMVFLRCHYGFHQLYRKRELTIQYQLTLPRVQDLDIFLPSASFQSGVAHMAKEYRRMISQSVQLYREAQKQLYVHSHFEHSRLFAKNTVEKSFSASFGATGRLDAEYYQPKYDELFTLLHQSPTEKLGRIVTLMKSIEPGSAYYADEGIPFIRVSDVSPMGIRPPSIHIPPTIVPSIEHLYPRKDTVLFSKDGSVGIAYRVEEDMEAVTSGALLHLRIREGMAVLPDYLALVLNSELVRLQAERDASGTVIGHWSTSDIQKIIVPMLPLHIQQDIAARVQQSFALRRRAERCIAAAVRAVEIAVEEDEAAALASFACVNDVHGYKNTADRDLRYSMR